MENRESDYPYLLTEAGFWRCPVSVFTGLTFMVVGITIGLILGLMA